MAWALVGIIYVMALMVYVAFACGAVLHNIMCDAKIAWETMKSKRSWKVLHLTSTCGIIYTVRDKPGAEREVQDLKGKWHKQSCAKFSLLPMYEDYHRNQYYGAKPLSANQQGKV
jgi:hypothetical protein